jgi:hypothetical protein
MNWIECSKVSEGLFRQSRFSMPADGIAGFNCETGLSISDITGGLGWLSTYLGDGVLRYPLINKFFELDPNHTGGVLSGVITTAIVFAGLMVVGLIAEVSERWFG